MAHYAWLCDSSLQTFARIMYLMEPIGELPPQLALICLAMLGKPAGGFKPIGLFPSPY